MELESIIPCQDGNDSDRTDKRLHKPLDETTESRHLQRTEKCNPTTAAAASAPSPHRQKPASEADKAFMPEQAAESAPTIHRQNPRWNPDIVFMPEMQAIGDALVLLATGSWGDKPRGEGESEREDLARTRAQDGRGHEEVPFSPKDGVNFVIT